MSRISSILAEEGDEEGGGWKGRGRTDRGETGVGTRAGGWGGRLCPKQRPNTRVAMATAFPGRPWRVLHPAPGRGGQPSGAQTPPAVVSSCFVTTETVTSARRPTAGGAGPLRRGSWPEGVRPCLWPRPRGGTGIALAGESLIRLEPGVPAPPTLAPRPANPTQTADPSNLQLSPLLQPLRSLACKVRLREPPRVGAASRILGAEGFQLSQS